MKSTRGKSILIGPRGGLFGALPAPRAQLVRLDAQHLGDADTELFGLDD